MHQGTCVTHVPWCMSGLLTRGGGENVPGIPGACAPRNFVFLVRGPRERQNKKPFCRDIRCEFISHSTLCCCWINGNWSAKNHNDTRGFCKIIMVTTNVVMALNDYVPYKLPPAYVVQRLRFVHKIPQTHLGLPQLEYWMTFSSRTMKGRLWDLHNKSKPWQLPQTRTTPKRSVPFLNSADCFRLNDNKKIYNYLLYI